MSINKEIQGLVGELCVIYSVPMNINADEFDNRACMLDLISINDRCPG